MKIVDDGCKKVYEVLEMDSSLNKFLKHGLFKVLIKNSTVGLYKFSGTKIVNKLTE